LFYRTEELLDYTYANELITNYLESRKLDYQSLLSLLPSNQQKLVIAIAKEGKVSKPTAVDFIMKYSLPSLSSSLQAVKVLAQKEIIYKTNEGYVVYDVFFRRFLEKYY